MEQLLVLQTLQFDRRQKSSAATAEMETLREAIPTPILAHYERLILRGKKGVAIARHGVCGECHLRIPSGTLAGLASDQDVHLCDNCGRYLYLPAEETIKASSDESPGATPSGGRPRKSASRSR